MNDYIEMILTEAYSKWLELREFADPLRDVKRNIHNLSGNIVEHILKVCMYKEQLPHTIHHWESEIVAGLNGCRKNKVKRKGKNSYPNRVELWNWINDKYPQEDDLDGLVPAITSCYPNLTVEKSNSQLWEELQKILSNCVDILSEKSVSVAEVHEILERYV